MRERPIPCKAHEVRAILSNTQTQMRRVVKGAPDDWAPVQPEVYSPTVVDRHGDEQPGPDAYGAGNADGDCWIRCPYGQPGDRLWVRETFAIVPRTAYRCSEGVQQTLRPEDDHDAAIYRAGWDRSTGGIRWRPSIHMPRWASRITLEVTGVRVERLKDISEADAVAEGIERGAAEGYWKLYGRDSNGDMDRSPRVAYRSLWESINGPGSWDANPWVWVIEFRRTA